MGKTKEKKAPAPLIFFKSPSVDMRIPVRKRFKELKKARFKIAELNFRDQNYQFLFEIGTAN